MNNLMFNRQYGKTELMLRHMEKVAKENPTEQITLICGTRQVSTMRERFKAYRNILINSTEFIRIESFLGINYGSIFVDHHIIEKSCFEHERRYIESHEENIRLKRKLQQIKDLLSIP